MKKFYVFISLLVLAITANAEYVGPGFYRVHNAGSDSYISIKGTAFSWTSNPDAFWGCIKMQPATEQTHVSDPATLIYIPYLEQTSLYAQGVDTYSLTELYMDVDTAKAREGGLPTYLAKTQVWISMNGEDKLFTCLFRDQGKGLTAGTFDRTEGRWWIEPVNEESMETSYYGVKPTDETVKDSEGMYWTTLCCDFPFLIPADGGVEGAYTVREVTQDENGSYCAMAVKVYGQGEVVPAATPVLLKCAAPTAEGNKLIPTGEIANNRTFPIVNDLLMGNYFSSYINHSNLQDASIMAEYVPEQATAATDCYLALGVDAEGRLGFFTKAEGTYMDANTAWLSTENLAMKDVTAIYLVEATAPVIMLGDADGDGVVSIKDVSFLIDYLLNGLPSKDETVGVLNFTGADVNRDGDVNIKDLSILIDQLLTTER